MKKFVAIILAMMFVFSGCVIALAEYDETGTANYTCPYCEATFKDAASLADHINATYPVEGHSKKCGNSCDKDFDGVEEVCPFETQYVSVMEQHKKVCEYDDTLSNWDKVLGYIKAGDIATALKYLGKAIIEFVKSDTFKDIVNKIVDVVKGIDFGSLIGKVKDIAGKIPFDTIIEKVKDIAA